MVTRQVRCGDVLIGGGAPVSVQSMTNVDSRNEAALLRQIEQLQDAGCQIVRVAVFDMEAVKAAGYRTVTPMIVTNTDNFAQIQVIKTGDVTAEDEVLSVK